MNRAAGRARSEDLQSLKHKGLDYVARQMPEGQIVPPIPAHSSKEATRGWTHPQIRELLIPACYLKAYQVDPEG
jgi:hypothetical protein